MKRPNLQVVTDALVHRVLLDGTRAVGVAFSRGGKLERADAAAEVILSAGAVGSPHILQLSGVGDPDHLDRAGIPVLHALPGVGRNFQDHFVVRVSCDVQGVATMNERSRGLPIRRRSDALCADRTWSADLRGFAGAASVKVLPESATPDVQALFASASYAPGPKRELDHKPGMTSGLWQMRPLSRAMCERARRGRRSSRRSIRAIWMMNATGARWSVAYGWCGAGSRPLPWRATSWRKRCPAPDVQSDDDLVSYARQTGSTVFHASCSCRMGPDAMSVVDDQLRVHGIEGLRVIDASVMPAVTSTNTNAPTIMIAEKGAAMVQAAARGVQAAAA